MPNTSVRKRIRKNSIKWFLKDEFSSDVAAGMTNGTFSTDGINPRTAIDAEGCINISNGNLNITKGYAAPGYGKPQMYWPVFARVPGRAVGFRFVWDGAKVVIFGVAGETTPNTALTGGMYWPNLNGGFRITGAAPVDTPTSLRLQANTEYIMVFIVRAAGHFYYIKGGAFTDWTQLYLETVSAVTTLYPMLVGYSGGYNFRWLRMPRALLLPSPIAQSTLSKASGSGQPLESVTNGIVQPGFTEVGGAGMPWTQNVGTWTYNASNLAVCSTLSGGVGIATLDTGLADIVHRVMLQSRVGGNIGVVFRFIDTSNYMRAYHDGTNLVVDEVVAGSVTKTTTAAKAFTANRNLIVQVYGNHCYIIYNDDDNITEITIDAAVLQSGTKIGIYTTNTANTFQYLNSWQWQGGSFARTLDKYFFNKPFSQNQAIFPIGDSKTAGDPWPGYLAILKSNEDKIITVHPTAISFPCTALLMREWMEANFAGVVGDARFVTLNIGANDFTNMPTEAAWLSDMRYIIDACRSKWNGVQVWVCKPWRRGELTDANTVASWVDTLVNGYANNVYYGPDERIWLENGDDGTSYTTDGTHYNDAGEIENSKQWGITMQI